MFTGRLTEEVFSKAKTRPYSDGSGTFLIRMGFPTGLRYYEQDRAITVRSSTRYNASDPGRAGFLPFCKP